MEQSIYLRENQGYSFLRVPREFCAAFVLLWGINPESFLYNWVLYAGVVVLWAGFAMMSEWKKFWQAVFKLNHAAQLLLACSDGDICFCGTRGISISSSADADFLI